MLTAGKTRMSEQVLYIFSVLLIFLSGCIFKEEPMPRIAYDASSAVSTAPALPSKPEAKVSTGGSFPAGWVPSSSVEKGWTAIVIHHSGTPNGNSGRFDKWAKEGKNWDGVGYDFVIGNGTDSGNGQVEVTFRWSGQKTGAHVGGTPGNWANEDAIGICLVGNFSKTVPTARQKDSLVKLVRFLQQRYGIPKSRVYGHKSTPGTRKTDCPGRYFPMKELKSRIL